MLTKVSIHWGPWILTFVRMRDRGLLHGGYDRIGLIVGELFGG
jgi:hypothetical protein